eukprot:gnl/TRDRNA2_/TRDRNA2_198776_c0_seq1.p1 gnl/TRDRNA2_/TRDRNA2_198776_c0~~gnl/TRDRNA2_/TRDRNA2_198776_c0_seq1.p1  ORF type:complete len:423 (-),score=95.91 gnl/TRDRNA2_/TRDRNA2_198776_c0_seq1:54-1322(-)
MSTRRLVLKPFRTHKGGSEDDDSEKTELQIPLGLTVVELREILEDRGVLVDCRDSEKVKLLKRATNQQFLVALAETAKIPRDPIFYVSKHEAVAPASADSRGSASGQGESAAAGSDAAAASASRTFEPPNRVEPPKEAGPAVSYGALHTLKVQFLTGAERLWEVDEKRAMQEVQVPVSVRCSELRVMLQERNILRGVKSINAVKLLRRSVGNSPTFVIMSESDLPRGQVFVWTGEDKKSPSLQHGVDSAEQESSTLAAGTPAAAAKAAAVKAAAAAREAAAAKQVATAKAPALKATPVPESDTIKWLSSLSAGQWQAQAVKALPVSGQPKAAPEKPMRPLTLRYMLTGLDFRTRVPDEPDCPLRVSALRDTLLDRGLISNVNHVALFKPIGVDGELQPLADDDVVNMDVVCVRQEKPHDEAH